MILDAFGTQEHEQVEPWLNQRRPFRIMPTSNSGHKLVERWL